MWLLLDPILPGQCMNNLTPGTVELTFHGDGDVQRLRLRRFGCPAKNLDVKSTDKQVGAVLGQPYSKSFLIADQATLHLKQLNATLKKEFEKTLLANQDAFRCAPFDLDYIHLDKDKETEAVDLTVAIKLDRSFGGPAFRLASHARNTPERLQKMGQAALEGGIAEILARFHRITAKFPDLKVITVLCSYLTTEAVLDTQTFVNMEVVQVPTHVNVYDFNGKYLYSRDEVRMEVAPRTRKTTVVKDQAAERFITFVMPTAQIPDTLDKKAISDAVLAAGKIILAK
jgi:hypothetical protein